MISSSEIASNFNNNDVLIIFKILNVIKKSEGHYKNTSLYTSWKNLNFFINLTYNNFML